MAICDISNTIFPFLYPLNGTCIKKGICWFEHNNYSMSVVYVNLVFKSIKCILLG